MQGDMPHVTPGVAEGGGKADFDTKDEATRGRLHATEGKVGKEDTLYGCKFFKRESLATIC